jgi:hypothetical protein
MKLLKKLTEHLGFPVKVELIKLIEKAQYTESLTLLSSESFQ